MSTSDRSRRWTSEHPDGPRLDVDGVAWFACDPYPTWYRWEGGRLIGGVPRFPKSPVEVPREDPHVDQ